MSERGKIKYSEFHGKPLVVKIATCAQSEFDDVDLSNSSFTNINFSGTSYDDVNMSGNVVRNANLSGSRIEYVNFGNVEIKNCNITGLRIDGVLVSELIAAYKAQESAKTS